MALTSSCCLNIFPPNTASNLPSTKATNPTQVPWFRNENWRRQCALGMACVVIGLESGNLLTSNHENHALAEDMQFSAIESKGKQQRGPRWSDKRMCPPWRQNSLENIVPENLPRPSAPGRWKSVGLSKTAPAVGTAVKPTDINNNCFSL